MNATIDLPAQQPGRFQHAKMLRNRRERNVKGLRQFGNGGFALRKARENGATSGIRKGAKSAIQSGAGIVNHMV